MAYNDKKSRKRTDSRARENRRARIMYILGKIRLYGSVFLFFFFCIALLAGIIFLCSLFLPISRTEKQLEDKITYELEGTAENIKSASLMRDGIIYVNFDEIAAVCGMTVSGDSSNLIYTAENGETASFDIGSAYVTLNGNSMSMEGAARLEGESLWVPFSFVQSSLAGIEATVSDDGSCISIRRGVTVSDEGTSPLSISFTLKGEDTLQKVSGSSLPAQIVTLPGGTPTYQFINDLTNYMQYMDPADRSQYLKLINSTERDDGSYAPTDLTTVINSRSGRNLSMRLCAEKALEALFIEMYASGYRDVYVNLAYRSYDQQKSQFNTYVYNERYYYRTHNCFSDNAYSVLGKSYLQTNYIKKAVYTLSASDAESVALSYSAYPGTGDHQTGLSADICNTSTSSQAFGDTEAYTWLKNYAYQFGFVERYPRGKEKITGFAWEPYHWRFVGQYYAAEMKEKNMCLEEYVAMLGGNQ